MNVYNIVLCVCMCFVGPRESYFVLQKGEPSKVMDDFDKAVRELQFERRGHASNRMKTEEELAAEEKERLEKLEVRFYSWEAAVLLQKCSSIIIYIYYVYCI